MVPDTFFAHDFDYDHRRAHRDIQGSSLTTYKTTAHDRIKQKVRRAGRQGAMKSFTDLFFSTTLSSKLLTVSNTGAIVLALAFLVGVDRQLAQAVNIMSPMNQSMFSWALYVSTSMLLLAVNFVSLSRAIRHHVLDRNDWARLKSRIFRERELIDLRTRQTIRKSIPLYLVLLGIALAGFGTWISIDTLFVSPVRKIVVMSSETIFSFHFDTLLSTFIFTFFPPYIFLLSAIYIKRFAKNS